MSRPRYSLPPDADLATLIASITDRQARCKTGLASPGWLAARVMRVVVRARALRLVYPARLSLTFQAHLYDQRHDPRKVGRHGDVTLVLVTGGDIRIRRCAAPLQYLNGTIYLIGGEVGS